MDPTRVVAGVVLALALGFGALAYLAEISVSAPQGNDRVLHLGAMTRANQVWQEGGNPRDPWIPYWSQGYPLLRYYQHFSHLSVVSLFRLARGVVPLEDLFAGVRFLLLVCAPLGFYAGARMAGFDRLAAAFSAACVPALAVVPGERFLTGFQASSYLWAGPGLYPQLAGMLLFAPAVGALQRALIRERGYGLALALLAALCLTHMLLGYMAGALSALALARPELAGRRVRSALRLGALGAATLLVASYVVVPAVVESPLLHRSVWESPEYWSSYGMSQVLDWLVRGALLDGERLPLLTLLAGGGLAVALLDRTHAPGSLGARRFAALAFLVSLALYFGRPTWGRLLDVLPFSDVLPMHRWICALHYASVLLAGTALAWIWERLAWRKSTPRLVAAVCATALLLAAPLASQWRLSRQAAAAQRLAAEHYREAGRGLHELLLDVHRRDLEEPGRGYAGTGHDWGKSYALGFVPVYMFWREFDVSAIAYTFMMSLNTDLEADFDPRRADHHDLFNVRYLLRPDRHRLPAFAQVFASRPDVYAARVDTPGYFSLVGVDGFYRYDGTAQRELLELNRAFVRSHRHAEGRFIRIGLGEDALPHPGERELAGAADVDRPAEGWRPPEGEVIRSWGHNDRFGATVSAAEPAHLLFRMTYHPGWRALVDGEPAETVMLSPSFVGVPIEAGTHEVELAYRPRGWTSLLFYAGMAVVGLALLADRLDAWRGLPRDRARLRRAGLEAAGVLALLALLRAVANAPIADERMPLSEAALEHKLAAWSDVADAQSRGPWH